MTLKTHLERCLVVELRAIARRQELRLQSLLKADIISQLERKITQSVVSKAYQTDLSEANRSALAALIDAGGLLPLAEAETRFGELRRVIPGAVEKHQPWGDGLSTVLDQLHVWGLLFRSPAAPPAPEMAVIPLELVERLRPACDSRPRTFRYCSSPASRAGDSDLLCQDLMLLSSALHEVPAPRLISGGISRRDLLRLNAHLLVPDEIADVKNERSARRFFFLRTLAEAMGLIQVDAGRFVTGPALDEWLSRESLDRKVSTVHGYLARVDWQEWELISSLQLVRPPEADTLTGAREFLLTLLTEADPDEWHTFASLVQAARSRNSFLLRRPGDGCAFRCSQTGRDLTPKDWSLVEGAWIEAAVKGPLFWLGLIEPGRTRRGELSAFRVPASSMAILAACRSTTAMSAGKLSTGQPGSYTPPDHVDRPGPGADSDSAGDCETTAVPSGEQSSESTTAPGVAEVVFDDDMGLQVGCRVDLARWFRLERTCDLVERGRCSRYRLSRERVRQRLQADTSAETILADFGADVPDAFRTIIGNWSNRFGQARIFTAVILTVTEPALMVELKSAAEIAACLEQPLGSRACIVRPERHVELEDLLRARGEMPHVELTHGPTLTPEGWAEVEQALALWKKSAAPRRTRGPSDSTCQAVAAIVALLPRERQSPAPTDDDSACVPTLEEAIQRKRTIQFDYSWPGGGSADRLTVLPRSMGQKKGVTYLSGYRKGGSSMDQFRVDCIRNIGPVS